jgi:hypothetical protein
MEAVVNALRVSLVAAVAGGLVACGGGAPLAPTKEAAAQALFASSNYANPPTSGANGAGLSAEVATDCRRGGRAKVKYDLDSFLQQGSSTDVAFTFDVIFENCSDDGETTMNGTLTTGYDLSSADPYNAELALTMKGRVNFSGAVSDFVDANVVQHISIEQHGTSSGSVSVRLSGTITTSSGTYTYDENESLSFDAGDFQTAVEVDAT